MSKPLIGITLDSEEGAPGKYSKFPWYALRENYAGAVAAAGGIPVALPHEPELAGEYLEKINGLLITGGAFDVDPKLFGAEERHDTVVTKDKRTRFEWAICQGALERKMPILGICGGQQLLHVVLGGKLVQHIPDQFEQCLAHEQPNPRNEPGHIVHIEANTLLGDIVGHGVIEVNSAHHQAIADCPEGVVLNAHAPDGVIEGMEAKGYGFCLGVQWHPEFFITDADRRLFAAFIDAARKFKHD